MGATAFGDIWLPLITGPARLTLYISGAPAHCSECWCRQDRWAERAGGGWTRDVGLWDREGTGRAPGVWGYIAMLQSCVMGTPSSQNSSAGPNAVSKPGSSHVFSLVMRMAAPSAFKAEKLREKGPFESYSNFPGE